MRRYIQSILLALLVLAMPTAAFAQNLAESDEKQISTAGADCSVSTRCAVFGLKDYPSIGIYINVATSGTFVFEATQHKDSNSSSAIWFAINDDVGGVGSATADGAFYFTNPGYSFIRIRASAINGTASLYAFRGFAGLRSTATLSGASQGDGAIQDGASSSIEATVKDLTNSNPLTVAVTDANGDQITSFGGGTQYATGTASAGPTGTVSLGWDSANVRALSTNASGHLNVIFPSAQAVSQSGTWNINNVSGTISLPTGAATAAKQPALGTAGTASTDVITVQGIASMTALQVSQSGTWNINNVSGTVSLPTGASTAANQTTAISHLSDIETVAGATTDAAASAGGTGTLSAKQRLMTSQLDSIDSKLSTTLDVNIDSVNGATPLDTASTATLQSAATANGNGSTLSTSGYSFVIFTVDCSVSCSGGTTINLEGSQDGTNYATLARAQRIDADIVGGVITDQASGAITLWGAPVAGLQAVRARISAYSAGTITVTATATFSAYTTANEGANSFRYTSAGSTEDEHAVKTTAGTLYSISATNTNASARYLRCANATAANTTPGSTTPILDLAIPAATSGLGFHVPFPKGLTFSTALTCWAVTGAADTDTTEVAANEIKLLYTYR